MFQYFLTFVNFNGIILFSVVRGFTNFLTHNNSRSRHVHFHCCIVDLTALASERFINHTQQIIPNEWNSNNSSLSAIIDTRQSNQLPRSDVLPNISIREKAAFVCAGIQERRHKIFLARFERNITYCSGFRGKCQTSNVSVSIMRGKHVFPRFALIAAIIEYRGSAMSVLSVKSHPQFNNLQLAGTDVSTDCTRYTIDEKAADSEF